MKVAKPITVLAVGDLVATNRLLDGDSAVTAGLEAWKTLFADADIVFGDLEAPLSLRGHPREKVITFRANPEIGRDLATLGFKVLSLANNHSLDYGNEALMDTIETLRANGVSTVGAGINLDAAMEPFIADLRGHRLGFMAFSCLLPVGAAAARDRPGIAPIHVHTSYEIDSYSLMEQPGIPAVVRTWADPNDLQQAVSSIKELRSRVDFLAASIHWGQGSAEEISEYQRPLAHALIDAGTDIVFGQHVHTVQGVEAYKGKAIMYSPSGFISQQPREGISELAKAIYAEMSPDGYVARIEIGTGEDYSLDLIPFTTGPEGLPEGVRGSVFSTIAQRLQRLSRALGTRLEVGKESIRVVL
jgi:poly-gamma-glutamate capsule biosynthesis protein CapA/YwtB (metallophosphatase superfamily)